MSEVLKRPQTDYRQLMMLPAAEIAAARVRWIEAGFVPDQFTDSAAHFARLNKTLAGFPAPPRRI